MFRTNNFGWKLTHALCILAHLGLGVAAAATYVYGLSKETRTRSMHWKRLASQHPLAPAPPTTSYCDHTLLSGELGAADWLDVDDLHTLPLTCLVVVCARVTPERRPTRKMIAVPVC